MKNSINVLLVITAAVMMTACSSTPKRTVHNDKNMRVFLDPDSIDSLNYVQVQMALVKSGKFKVIDRGVAFKAVQKEQEREHRNQADRYSDEEKWAHYGKMYGVGSIVVAHAQCYKQRSFWRADQVENVCKQFLTLIDASTGEIIVSVDGEGTAPATYDHQMQAAPSWEKVTEKFIAQYPERFDRARSYDDNLLNYQAVSKEEALRQKERNPAGRQ